MRPWGYSSALNATHGKEASLAVKKTALPDE
jgi:hypothetical protein